jgi:glucose-6-phosphate 1-epimerase
MTFVAMLNFGQLQAVQLTTPAGAEAIITLFGAQVVSWKTSEGVERLFCSRQSALDGSKAIRGGVPVIFPQFAERGQGMRHGFARVSTWRLSGSGRDEGVTYAVFSLTRHDLPPAVARTWPHDFTLYLRIGLDEQGLHFEFIVRNTGDESFSFSSALHSYFKVADVAKLQIRGVQPGELAIEGHHDEIYRDVAGPIELVQPGATLRLEQHGFTDAVVWNPGAEMAADIADLAKDEVSQFVCIEPAMVTPYQIAPATSWGATHRISLLG